MSSIIKLFRVTPAEVKEAFSHATVSAQKHGLKLLAAPVNTEINKDCSYNKLLVIISRKAGKAHKRNLFRRRAKSAFYEQKLYALARPELQSDVHNTPQLYILIVYKQGINSSFSEIKDFLIAAIKTTSGTA